MPPKKKPPKKGTSSGRRGDPRPQIGGGKKGRKKGGKKPQQQPQPVPTPVAQPIPVPGPHPENESFDYDAGTFDTSGLPRQGSPAWQRRFLGFDALGRPVPRDPDDALWQQVLAQNGLPPDTPPGAVVYSTGDAPGAGGGGDFDEDGNFVGGGQGGFDEDGNPVGGGAVDDGEAAIPGFTSAQNSLLSTVKDLLSQFDLDTPGLLGFVTQAISKGWDQTQIMLELRKHPDYLANPLFAANIEATKGGARFRSEGELLAYATEVRRISRQYGFTEPPTSYIAQGVLTNKSLAEVEHLLQIQKQTEIYGPAFRGFVEQEMGINLSDQDLFEIFDPERDTQDFDDKFRAAQYRARPFTLGLGIRSEAEQRALEMLGVDPEEAFRRFESVAANAPAVKRLQSINDMVLGNLPNDFGAFMASIDNQLLVDAEVFQKPEARAEIQRLMANEIARFNVGGGAATAQGGQAVGLLTGVERESYG